MNSREEKDVALLSQTQGTLESSFLEEELFGEEKGSDQEARLGALEAESLFRHAFEHGKDILVEPEKLEEELIEDEEWVEVEDFPVEEAYDDEATADTEESEDEVYDDEEAQYSEVETVEKKVIARMKFEFQTWNRVLRNDGKTARPLGRKYGPDDFLVKEEVDKKNSVRLESETGGVIEFETDWFRTWPKLEKAINKAIKMTEDMNNAGPSKLEKTRKAFPFNVDHLRKGSAKEMKQGFWDKRPGMEVEEEHSFSVDLKYQADLDKRALPNDLRKEFQDKGFELSKSATVKVKKAGSRWEIWDKDYRRTYFVNKEKGALKIYDKERILGANEELEVEIRDVKINNKVMKGKDWWAGIQSSECFLLEYYESFLRQHEWPHFIGGTIKHAKAILDAANTEGIHVTELAKLRSFLQIIVNYIMRGQDGTVAGSSDLVKNNAAKQAFALMSRTNFASMYKQLLTEKERTMFKIIVNNDLILNKMNEMNLSRETPFFKEGYGKKEHKLGPTVHEWLQGILSGKDLLSGLSAAMGRYGVETRKGRKDRWLVKFEIRNRPTGAWREAKKWVDYASELFNLASNRERDALKLAYQQGITDENKLTNFVFHARRPDLKGHRIQKGERKLAQEWLRIRDELVRPLLQGIQPEMEEFEDDEDRYEQSYPFYSDMEEYSADDKAEDEEETYSLEEAATMREEALLDEEALTELEELYTDEEVAFSAEEDEACVYEEEAFIEAETARAGTVVFPSGESLRILTGFPEGRDQEYWDPINSGNPLLDTGASHKAKKLSTSFTVRELASSGGVSADVARIDPKLVEALQQLRDHIGKPITITSGYRSWNRNRELYEKRGKKPTYSQHCAGRAADIKIQGMNGFEIGKAAIDACGPNIGVGLARTFAHLDVRGHAAAWNYSDSERGWVEEIKEYQRAKGGSPRGTPAMGQKPAAVRNATLQPAETGRFLKDLVHLQNVALTPTKQIAVNESWPGSRRALARTYNRLGGLMNALSAELAVKVAGVLAVWLVESGGRTHTPGQAIIRFENHLLFRMWGQSNERTYNQHFRHGGHDGQPGKAWEGHQFRDSAELPFKPVHTGKQADEYAALSLVRRLAGDAVALQCISIGGPQILVSHYNLLGYKTPRDMYNAFQTSERSHVIGFFDFCRGKPAPKVGQLIEYLREKNWNQFARYYNGPGQVSLYGGKIGTAYREANAMLVLLVG